MKNVYGIIILLLALVFGLNALYAQSPCTFTDNFDDGIADDWSPLTPDRWQVSSDAGSLRYFLNTTNYESPDGIRMGELSLLSGRPWSDFTFECLAKSADAANGAGAADLCIAFGYQDFDSYYYINFNSEPGLTQLFRIHNGSPALALATYGQATFTDGNYHALRIERNSSQIRAFFDGQQILSAVDNFFGEGLIGVGSYNDSGYFDNVMINCPSACNYSIFPISQSFAPSGGTGSVSVSVESGCNWTAGSNVNWINITSGNSGAGNGIVTYSVTANNSGSLRTGTLTIAEQTFTVIQYSSCFSEFLDNFEDGVADGWAPLTASRWQVSNDAGSLRYFLNTTNYDSPDGIRLGELSLLSGRSWSDFTFECLAKSVDAANGAPASDLCIIFGYQDFDSYYYMMFNSEPGLTQLFRNHDGNPAVILATYHQATFADGEYHSLRVERTGNLIRAYFDGRQIISASDSFFGAGPIGVGSRNDSGFFDNMRIAGCSTQQSQSELVADRIYLRTGTNSGPEVDSPVAGQPYYLHFDWRNIGTAATPDFRLELRLNGNVLCAYDAGITNPNSSSTAYCATPVTWPAGSSTIEGVLDVTNVVIEPNENNNAIRRTFTAGAEIRPEAITTQAIGAEFIVDVAVSSVQNLFGVSFELTYNTTHIDALSAEAGAFLGNDVIFLPTLEDNAGKVSIGVSRKQGQGGVSGGGVVARIKFKSLVSTPSGTQVFFALRNVAANDPSGGNIPLISSATVTVTITGLIVWPGDTNNDGIVNQTDVLPLGLHWNRTGPPRQNASTTWIGQAATPWSPDNATYADANGNGVINQADVLPIGLNWGRTHTTLANMLERKDNLPVLSKLSAASISLNITGDTNPGQDFWSEVVVEQISSLFGISFEVVYSPTTLVDPQTVEPGSFIGNDLIFFPIIDKNQGKISIGISRKAGQGGVDGSGVVARIKMHVSSQAMVGQVIALILQSVTSNDPAGQPIQLSITPSRSVVVSVESKRQKSLPECFALYANSPNPFNPQTTIKYDLAVSSEVRVEIFDMLGKPVRTLINQRQSAGQYTVTWDGRDGNGRTVSSGVFIYQFQAGKFVQSRKMILLK